MKDKLMNPMVDFAFKELFGSDEEEKVKIYWLTMCCDLEFQGV